MLSDSLKEKLQHLATLQDVAARYLTLHRSGTGYRACCPFHPDKHPSLHIHPGKQIYKCFACGAGGDMFGFVQRIEACSFPEALRLMAGWYDLPVQGDTPPVRKQPRKYVPSQAKVEVASPRHIASLRQAHLEMLNQLQPYHPEEETLREVYRQFEVGLAPDALPADYRMMAGRLIFPIRNHEGDLVAFAGRRISDACSDRPKYINSPGSVLYNKSELLYGLFQAAESIRHRGYVLIVEGYKDALAMHAAGFTQTVALCGTALTDGHLSLLGQYTRCLVLLLDGDAAGSRAMHQLQTSPCEAGRAFRILSIPLPAGDDPDSMYNRLGSSVFRQDLRQRLYQSRVSYAEKRLRCRLSHQLHQLENSLTPSDRRQQLHQFEKHRRALTHLLNKHHRPKVSL